MTAGRTGTAAGIVRAAGKAVGLEGVASVSSFGDQRWTTDLDHRVVLWVDDVGAGCTGG